MIYALTYRPRRIEFEGCQPLFAIGILAALACHKGDASLTQQSTQTGAQTGGVVLSGVTLNQAGGPITTGVGRLGQRGQTTYPSGGGGGGINSGGNAAGGTNIVTLNTDTNLPAALDALGAALAEAQAANQTTATLAQSAIDSQSGFSSGLQKIAAMASILAGAYLGYRVLFRKKDA